MATISIEVTDIEMKCMEYCAASPQEWADNAVTNRARIAGDEIVNLVVKHCNDNSIALEVGRDAQIQQAFDLGVVKTAAQVNAEAEDSLASE